MIQLTFLIVNFILILSVHASTLNDTKEDSSNWDILIFTQHWPITVCYQWQEKKPSNKCSLPILNNIWTVHGVWPTKLGTKGPENCNTTSKFDPEKLQPIEPQLQNYWTNIESNTPRYSFWKHEWDKHGTCAAELSDLDSESKYFNKGLNWIYKYEMKSILSRSNILPDLTKEYYPEDVYNAVKSVTNKNPALECYKDGKSKKTYISEIRLCFDKNLELIDCDGIREMGRYIDNEKILTNCHLNETLVYTNLVPNPPTTRPTLSEDYKKPQMEFLQSTIDFYRIIKFLRWLTL